MTLEQVRRLRLGTILFCSQWRPHVDTVGEKSIAEVAFVKTLGEHVVIKDGTIYLTLYPCELHLTQDGVQL